MKAPPKKSTWADTLMEQQRALKQQDAAAKARAKPRRTSQRKGRGARLTPDHDGGGA